MSCDDAVCKARQSAGRQTSPSHLERNPNGCIPPMQAEAFVRSDPGRSSASCLSCLVPACHAWHQHWLSNVREDEVIAPSLEASLRSAWSSSPQHSRQNLRTENRGDRPSTCLQRTQSQRLRISEEEASPAVGEHECRGSAGDRRHGRLRSNVQLPDYSRLDELAVTDWQFRSIWPIEHSREVQGCFRGYQARSYRKR